MHTTTITSLPRRTGPFPQLTPPLGLVDDITAPGYLSRLTSGGTARLRIWATGRGHLAVLTRVSAPTTASALPGLHAALTRLVRDGELVIVEHVPGAAPGAPHGHWDQVSVTPGGEGRSRRIWPAPPGSPDRDLFAAWVTASAATVGIPQEARP